MLTTTYGEIMLKKIYNLLSNSSFDYRACLHIHLNTPTTPSTHHPSDHCHTVLHGGSSGIVPLASTGLVGKGGASGLSPDQHRIEHRMTPITIQRAAGGAPSTDGADAFGTQRFSQRDPNLAGLADAVSFM